MLGSNINQISIYNLPRHHRWGLYVEMIVTWWWKTQGFGCRILGDVNSSYPLGCFNLLSKCYHFGYLCMRILTFDTSVPLELEVTNSVGGFVGVKENDGKSWTTLELFSAGFVLPPVKAWICLSPCRFPSGKGKAFFRVDISLKGTSEKLLQ